MQKTNRTLLRKSGNSDILLRQVLKGVSRENIECSSIQLRDIQFQGCIGCEKCRKPEFPEKCNEEMSYVPNNTLY